MANYNCTIRTNYFHVKDNKKFEEFMSNVYGEDLKVFNGIDSNGNQTYGFGCYGGISGYFNSKEDYADNDEAWDKAKTKASRKYKAKKNDINITAVRK